jgi:aminopeptidase N
MMRLMLAFGILAVLSCTGPGANQALAQSARATAPVLSEAHARERSARVSNVAYDLRISLSGELPEYSGEVTIRFALAAADRDLTIDFGGGTVHSLTANAEGAEPSYNGYYITVPARLLRPGANTIAIAFSRPYSDDGTGLYRFIDPEDGRAYLYTDFEPYDQNRLFPAFDQPDLKARFTTEVTAPADWQVIANTRETSVIESGRERVWQFPATNPISTYVYALHAGQYHVWESEAGNIPLRLFARESLVPYIHPEHWFGPTQQGFGFYQSYFDIPYPFAKYDQVVVPHFNSGAMENVGAVTFSERYLTRGAVTRQDRRSITSVILHEMAHMWFGDLVTMRWWNGLWLNESFATVMAVISMVEATEFDDEWQESYQDTIRAYQADERDTTHPIELPIADTDGAFANFDRITYQKGSATLVQLMHLVGPENFRNGVRDYLATHAFRNTTIDDFLGAISAASGTDLSRWAEEWLLEPGTNAVDIDYSCRAGAISDLEIVQSAPEEWPTLRTHRTQLGLYRFDDSSVDVATVPVTYSGRRTEVPDALGLPCPDLAYANHGDWDYARVRLPDDASDKLKESLTRFDDSLTRLMLWQSVWDQVQDGDLAVSDYLAFVLENLDEEPSEAAIRQVLATITASVGYLEEILPGAALESTLRARVESYLWEHANDSRLGTDRQLLFYDRFVHVARGEASLNRLAGLLDDPDSAPDGIEIDQDRRWSIVSALISNGYTGAAGRLAAERERDRTDEGQLRARSAEAGAPDPRLKADLIRQLLDPDAFPNLAEFRAVAGGLFPAGQHDLQLAMSSEALGGLRTLTETRDAGFYSSYVFGVIGSVCSPQYLESLEDAIAAGNALHPIIVRGLKDQRFDVARCLRIAATQRAAR